MSSDIFQVRLDKLEQLRQNGNAYPNDFRPLHAASDVNLTTETETKFYQLAGRIMTKRGQGKASFFHLQDHSGQIQVFVSFNDVGEENYAQFKTLDIGDIVGVSGNAFTTKTGELTIRAEFVRLLVKSLNPMPEKFHGIADQEISYRQRYLDLLTNEESKARFLIRSKIISTIRSIMDGNNYIEVETPMMHPIPGGANAKPFITHHNKLNTDLYLRIAPELYLKRLLIGGMDKVYEINRNFRNEGMSTRHNPEFTMMEFYCVHTDYHYMINYIIQLFDILCRNIVGSNVINYQGHRIDMADCRVITMAESISQYCDIPKSDVMNADFCRQYIKDNFSHETNDSLGLMHNFLFEKVVEPELIQPTFITEYPVEISPLARQCDHDTTVTERFELFVAGRELANGFSELNDPIEQAKRFQAQSESFDDEAMHYDDDYIEAMKYGLPPCSGCGIGIDRLVMLFTNAASIKDVILFPQMKKI